MSAVMEEEIKRWTARRKAVNRPPRFGDLRIDVAQYVPDEDVTTETTSVAKGKTPRKRSGAKSVGAPKTKS